MARNTYIVSENTENERDDSSFRACICALLAVLTISVVLILIGAHWKHFLPGHSNEKDETELLELSNNDESNEKLIVITAEEKSISKLLTIILTTPTTVVQPLFSTYETAEKISNTIFTDNIKTKYTLTTPKTLFEMSETREISLKGTTNEDRVITATFPKNDELEFSPETFTAVDDREILSSTFTHNSTLSDKLNDKEMRIDTTQFPEKYTTLYQYTAVTKQETEATNTPSNLNGSSSLLLLSTLASENASKSTTRPTLKSTVSTIAVIASSTINKTTIPTLQTTSSYEITTSSKEAYFNSSTISSRIFLAQSTGATNSPISTSTTKPVVSLIKLPPPKNICTTSECNSAASHMLTLMNHSADACEDFYEFACGGIDVAPSAETQDHSWLLKWMDEDDNTISKYLRQFKNFYESCLSHEDNFVYSKRIADLKTVLQNAGNIQQISSIATFDHLNFTKLVAQLLLRNSIPLFDIGLDIDEKSKTYIFQLTLPNESTLQSGYVDLSALSNYERLCISKERAKIYEQYLNLTEIYDSYLACKKNYSSYLNTLGNTLDALDVFLSSVKASTLQNVEDVLKILDHLPSPTEIRKTIVNKEFKLLTVSDVQRQFGLLEWKELLELLTGHVIQDNNYVQVYFLQYFLKVFQEFSKMNLRELSNALLSMYAHDLYSNIMLERHQNKRDCIQLVSDLFPDINFYLYKIIHSADSLKVQQIILENAFTQMKRKFSDSLNNSEWLDDKSRNQLSDKTNYILLSFSSKVNLKDVETTLKQRYENLQLKRNGYVVNLEKVITLNKLMFYGLHGNKFSPEHVFQYFLHPTSKTPRSYYSTNTIAVPDGLLQDIHPEILGYSIMASIGWRIAKEFGRHFNPVGIHNGVTFSSTSKTSYADLVQTTKEMLKYASPRSYRYQNISFQLNGTLSANLRIAENLAFRLILDSLDLNSESNSEILLPWISSTYSTEKIVFIQTAQEFCKTTTILKYMKQIFESEELPPSLMVENLMSNSETFVDVFKCGEGAGMNSVPVKKYQFPDLLKFEDDYYYNTS